MADKNHPMCTKMLHHHGFLTWSEPTMKHLVRALNDRGRADIFAARSSKAVAIECKYGKTSFVINQDNDEGTGWKPKQRRWAYYCQLEPFNIEYWIFLTVGKHPPHYNPEKYKPRRSWLIPYDTLMNAIEKLGNIQKSIPYQISKYMSNDLKEIGLDLVTEFSDYECEWQKNSSLEKPAWVKYDIFSEMEEKHDVNKVRDAINPDRKEYYGGFWTIPEEHTFYENYIK